MPAPKSAPTPEPATAELSAVPDAPAAEPEKESTVRQRLLGQTMIALREAHREEFDQMAREVFRKEGLEYTRRLTDKERASKKIIDLARANGLDVTITPAGSTD